MPISDAKGFVATLAARYGSRLRRYLSVRLRNVHDVPDVAQEVFLRLLRVRREDAIRNPEAYLFTVASHVLQQHTLRRNSDPVFVDIADAESDLVVAATEEPPSQVDQVKRIEILVQALGKLPPRVSAALVMHRLGGYTVQEIADELGVAHDTVKKYLMRAAQHCRKGRAGRALAE
jgi:RNA polymerase sigma factor (sigma-70 family)